MAVLDAAGLAVSASVTIPEAELEFTAIRAQGAGGQNVGLSLLHAFDNTAAAVQRLVEAQRNRRRRRIGRCAALAVVAPDGGGQRQVRLPLRVRLGDTFVGATQTGALRE